MPRLLSPTAALLVGDIRTAVTAGGADHAVAARVAKALTRHLSDPRLLDPEHREPDPNHYRQHVLHVEPDGSFSVVALVWLPGQETCIHDHVSWCVIGTYVGEEEETTYRLAGDRLGSGVDVDFDLARGGFEGCELAAEEGRVHEVAFALLEPALDEFRRSPQIDELDAFGVVRFKKVAVVVFEGRAGEDDVLAALAGDFETFPQRRQHRSRPPSRPRHRRPEPRSAN